MGSAPDSPGDTAAHHGSELELDLTQEIVMSRFIVERSFPEDLLLPANDDGANACVRIIGGNAESGVTWLHSYVTADKTKTYCVYDAPSPEAIRHVARRNGLPVDRIVEVTVLDPHFYH
jgi:hypothetical protein